MPRRKRGDGKSARSMKSLDLESYWSWLPTFRVVAERENLQEASRLLRLSASSISRTVRLLEKELGGQLFARETGRLQLTPSGRDFLEAVRRSMRLVDDGATALRAPDGSSPFRLSIPRALSRLVAIPTIARLASGEAKACFYVSHDGDGQAVASGMVDLVVTSSVPRATADVEVHPLGELPLGIYCGREHSLFRAGDSPIEALLAHPFITTQADAIEVGCWPPEHRRQVALDVADFTTGMEACAASLGLAVLPRAAARELVDRGILRRIEGPKLQPARLYALRRPRLARDRAQWTIEALALTVRGLAH